MAKARVLVVEDDEASANLFRTVLEVEDYEVQVAVDGRAGLSAFEKFEPDVVVLDWMMPGMSGIEMLERLKAAGRRRKTRIVLVTGKVQETDMLKAWQAGIDAYLTKPVSNMEHLLDTVDFVLKADPETLEKQRAQELERTRLLRTLDDLDER